MLFAQFPPNISSIIDTYTKSVFYYCPTSITTHYKHDIDHHMTSVSNIVPNLQLCQSSPPVTRSQKDFNTRCKQGLRQTSQWLTIHSTGSHLQTSPLIQRVVGRLWHSTGRARVPTSRLLAGAKSLAGSKRDGVSWGGGTCQQPITWWDWPSAHPVYNTHTHIHVWIYTNTH